MSNRLLQLPKAQKEILDAWEWYEDKQQGLGDRFKDEVYKKIKLIQSNPFYYPLKGKYREVKIDVFPYLIIFNFNEKDNLLLIVSVFHTSRHPDRKS